MYSSREVAQIVGVQESRVRYWAQTGFIGPSERKAGRPAYSFQDLVSVKAAKELLERGVTVQRARKMLEALRAQLPEIDRPLAQLRIVSDGERLVVQGPDGSFEPASGQLVMDFGLEALSAEVAARPAPVEASPAADSAYDEFQRALALDERGERALAQAAYERALFADPQLAAAHTNLGNLWYQGGALEDARRHYHAALTLDPEQPEARYNLGNLYDQLGEHERAIAEWTQVVNACPEFADAHFNLGARLCAEGSGPRARVHLERYLQLDGEGAQAAEARRLLSEK
jgi:tetratricopeptide (TPR) repeat protein